MRFLNSLRNSSLAFAGQIITILMGVVLRWFFIKALGSEYLGVNSLMESILTLLSMTELGIGTSIAFALYKPVDRGDHKMIAALMLFYRKVYHIIGILTAVLGLCLIPFMHFFTKDVQDVGNINLIYILFLANTVLSYFFAYKRTLLSAYQQNYIVSVTEDLSCVIKYVLQAIAIIVYKSFIGYIVINVVLSFAANYVISKLTDRIHPIADEYKKEKLSKEEKLSLKNSVVSLMYQKIGGNIVTGTDNLMISSVNIALLGFYSNYSMIVSIVERVTINVVRSIIGSVGNLMVQDNEEHKYKTYEEFVFATFACFFFISIGFSACIERFIGLWAGAEWVLPSKVTFVVVMNFFLQGMRQANIAIIDTTGVFNKLRPKAIAEVLVNLIVSFLFLIVFKMGIYGVLFGTTVSKLGVCIWWEALAVHKYAFKKSSFTYTIKFLKSCAVAAVGCFAAHYISTMISVEGILGLILSGICATAIYAIVILLIYGRSDEMRGMIGRFKDMAIRKTQKN